jgi:hypothetical protein
MFPSCADNHKWLNKAMLLQHTLTKEIHKSAHNIYHTHVHANVARQHHNTNLLNHNHFKRISTILNPKTNSLPTNILTPTLELVSEPNKIKRVTHNFWKLMFTKPPTPNRSLPSCYTKTRPRLTIHNSKRITRPITAKELNLVLKHIKTSSAPGLDEINNAMLKALDEPNRLDLLAFINNTLSDPSLPPGMNKSKLWTIYKQNNKANLNNYQPIALCQTTYKLLTTIIND